MADKRSKEPKSLSAKRSVIAELDGNAPQGVNHWGGNTTSGLAWEIHRGDSAQVLKTFKESRFHCVVTSPPYYWQRDYGVDGQIGLESTIAGYVTSIVAAMEDGSCQRH